jgi:predicted lipoprotein with Yx(FWY)xxD motif
MSDGDGNVLYFFTRDVKGASNCNEGCIENWPAISADLLSSSSGLEPSDFGSIQRNDGTNQTTYRGWPLYYFANDNQPGTVNGDGVNDAWYVANPNYSIMIADEQLVGADGNNYKSDYTQGDEITTFFTDSLGRTLYRFVNDEHNTNNFTNDDFSNDSVWPIFYQPIDDLPSSMDEADFDVIEVHGERQQLTYKGWPLYYFGGTNDVEGDQEPGETRGVSFPEPGVWPIVNTDVSEAPAPE